MATGCPAKCLPNINPTINIAIAMAINKTIGWPVKYAATAPLERIPVQAALGQIFSQKRLNAAFTDCHTSLRSLCLLRDFSLRQANHYLPNSCPLQEMEIRFPGGRILRNLSDVSSRTPALFRPSGAHR